MKNYTKTK